MPVVFDWQRDLLSFAKKHADGDGGKLFSRWSNQRRVLSEVCDRIGIEHVTLTSLRHGFAHRMKEEGIRQEDLAVAMGHRDQRMLDWIYGRARSAVELTRRFDHAAAERRAALVLLEGGQGKTDKTEARG